MKEGTMSISIELYSKENGDCPVAEFISSLSVIKQLSQIDL